VNFSHIPNFEILRCDTLAEEATLDTKEQKKESGHTDQASTSKGHDKKRKAGCSINAVEWPWHHKEHRPRPWEFEGFLDRICIFHPRESTRPRTTTESKVSQMSFSRRPKGPIKRKSLRILRETSLRLIKRSTTSMVAPSHMSQGGSKNSQPRRSWWSHPPPPEYLKWSEVPITFDHSDHPDFVPKPRRYPLK
jgi:hypothetical protein